MKRPLAALSLVLVAVGLTTACAPRSSEVEDHVVTTVSTGSTITVADLVGDSDARRFTIVCPYELPEDIAARLSVSATDLPDLSTRDDAQALVAVTADGVEATEFPRDRVDLCADGTWPAFASDDTATAAVTRNDDGVYGVTRTT
jgi:hypothetical protein